MVTSAALESFGNGNMGLISRGVQVAHAALGDHYEGQRELEELEEQETY
jgi:hypothetical protein